MVTMLNATIHRLIIIVLVSVLSTQSTDASKKVGFKKNMKIAAEWQCKHPQPRLIPIGSDELKDYAAPNILYQPPVLLIHRCDESTGCCQTPGEVCSSVENLEESILFAIHAQNTVKRKGMKQSILLRNHTHCHCTNIRDSKSRAKRADFAHFV